MADGHCVEVAFAASTRCVNDTHCVEVAVLGHEVRVRDSKNPDGPVLTFTPDEWATFCDGVRAGEFDA